MNALSSQFLQSLFEDWSDSINQDEKEDKKRMKFEIHALFMKRYTHQWLIQDPDFLCFVSTWACLGPNGFCDCCLLAQKI